MGQLFSGSGLTQAALVNPGGGTQAMPSTADAMTAANRDLQSVGPMVSGDVLNPSINTPTNLPAVAPKPSFYQAASAVNPQTGMPVSPLANSSLTKGGKLLAMLGLGLHGALAGRGAQEQMIAESGGRRSGGVGTGFQAGFQLPMLQRFQQAQLQRQQLENETAQTGLQQMQTPIQTPNGTMPFWQAQRMGQLQLQQSQIAKNRYVPSRNGILDTQTQAVVPGTENMRTPEQATFSALTNGGMSPEDALSRVSQLKNPQAQPLSADRVGQLNDGLEQLWQADHPQQPLPDAFKLPANATAQDFSRVDSLLQHAANFGATQAQRDTANAMRQQALEMQRQNQQDREQAKNKPTADEQRRADLANNMNENLDSLEEIAQRRPDLFGPVAGRWANFKQWVGTDDPDIARLHAIHEYLGMASVGAHSMRNAQHVAAAADAVMNGFHSSPGAVVAAINQARSSLKTFGQDVQNAKNPQNAPAAPSSRPQSTSSGLSGKAAKYGVAPLTQ